jgi:hypothetical protein
MIIFLISTSYLAIYQLAHYSPVFKNCMYRNIFLSHWISSLHIMFYSLSEKTNTINLLLKNNNNNKCALVVQDQYGEQSIQTYRDRTQLSEKLSKVKIC